METSQDESISLTDSEAAASETSESEAESVVSDSETPIKTPSIVVTDEASPSTSEEASSDTALEATSDQPSSSCVEVPSRESETASPSGDSDEADVEMEPVHEITLVSQPEPSEARVSSPVGPPAKKPPSEPLPECGPDASEPESGKETKVAESGSEASEPEPMEQDGAAPAESSSQASEAEKGEEELESVSEEQQAKTLRAREESPDPDRETAIVDEDDDSAPSTSPKEHKDMASDKDSDLDTQPVKEEPAKEEEEEEYRPRPSAAKVAFLAKLALLETDIDSDLKKERSAAAAAALEDRPRQSLTKETARGADAVSLAKELLKEGREMQKISVVRNFPELLTAHPEETTSQVLPLLNETLASAGSSLDLHCESALVFRKVLGRAELREAAAELAPALFASIAANLASPDTDNISAVAWIETLVEVVDGVPAEALQSQVLPIAVQQCQQAKSVQRRIAAIKLFHKVLPRLSPSDVTTRLIPCVQALCQDPSAQVRNATAERLLPPLASPDNLASPARREFSELVLPLLVELCSDDDPGVQETALDVLAACIPGFPPPTLRDVVVPLVQKCGEKAFQLDNSSLCVIAKNIGPWAYGLREVCSPDQRTWFTDFYRRICRLGLDAESGAGGGMCQSDDLGLGGAFDAPDPVHAACREWAAHNFPGVLVTEGVGSLDNSALQATFAAFCTDPDEGVRKKIAQGFAVVAGLVEEFPTDQAAKARMRNKIQEAFISLVRGGDLEVVAELTKNFADLLPILYAGAVEYENGTMSMALSGVKMNRMLLAFNRLIRNSPNWRCQEAFLLGLGALREVLPTRTIQQTFLPLLKEEVLSSRAVPCRRAAAKTLLLMARDSSAEQLALATEFFVETLCKHASCHKRALFVDVARLFREHCAPEVFKASVLPPLVTLLSDSVSNVRQKTLAEMGAVKKMLSLPEDEGLLSQMEAGVGKAMEAAEAATARKETQRAAAALAEERTKDELPPPAQAPATPEPFKEDTPPPVHAPPKPAAEVRPMEREEASEADTPSESLTVKEPKDASTRAAEAAAKESSLTLPPRMASCDEIAEAMSASSESESEPSTAESEEEEEEPAPTRKTVLTGSRPLKVQPTATTSIEVVLARVAAAEAALRTLPSPAPRLLTSVASPTIRLVQSTKLPPKTPAKAPAKPPAPKVAVKPPVAATNNNGAAATSNGASSEEQNGNRLSVGNAASSQLRIGKPRTAIVRPQPKMVMTRSPSPRPEGVPEKPPPKATASPSNGASEERRSSEARKGVSERVVKLAEDRLGLSRRRVSTPILRPVPRPSPSAAAAKSTSTIRRGMVGSVRQMSSRWEGDRSAGRPPAAPIVLPVAGKPLERKSVSTVPPTPHSTAPAQGDRNNNGRGVSGIPQPLRRGSLQEEPGRVRLIDNGGPNPLRPSASSTSIKHNGFGFGLMKVSSASAIHQKSSSVLSMSTKSRRQES